MIVLDTVEYDNKKELTPEKLLDIQYERVWVMFSYNDDGKTFDRESIRAVTPSNPDNTMRGDWYEFVVDWCEKNEKKLSGLAKAA